MPIRFNRVLTIVAFSTLGSLFPAARLTTTTWSFSAFRGHLVHNYNNQIRAGASTRLHFSSEKALEETKEIDHKRKAMPKATKRARDEDERSVGSEDETPKPRKRVSKAAKSLPDQPERPPLPFVPSGFDETRARLLTKDNLFLPATGDCVIYWMSRDQRANDNHALLYAQGVAEARNVPLKVVFNLVPTFLEATIRQYGFMIKGLQEVEEQLREKNIPMHLLMGDPTVNIPRFALENNAIAVVVDFGPLRLSRIWVNAVAATLDSSVEERKVPLVQADAHNVVPCWEASPKLEYGARTIRPKIQSKLPHYLKTYPEPSSNPAGSLSGVPKIDWVAALASLNINRTVPEVNWLQPGATAALAALQQFISSPRLKDFSDKRNDPNAEAFSNLSPYIHFGQISVQRIVLELKASKKYPSSADVFIEEAVVRRELADNFCFYNPNYDNLDGCYDWAKETLRIHSTDPRAYVYTLQQLEDAHTHDDLWNAAQIQMTTTGKMHGFLRMYWAKKILEWTTSPEEALRFAIFLNDKYNLDGRDPNGYVGCMWSIGGIHDQGWGERAIFGKIRFMNYEGCKRKFDVARFVSRYPPAAENAAKAGGTTTSTSTKKKAAAAAAAKK